MPPTIEAATKALAQGTEAFAAARMNHGIQTALAGKNISKGMPAAELLEDLLSLEATWKGIQKTLKGAVPPQKILSEQGKTNSILRDLLNEDFNKITVNDKAIFTDTKNYIQRIAPQKVDIISHYNSSIPIFDQYGITKQVKAAFGRTVNLPSGAYLIIEHTEALHVIDVNSGYKSVSNNQEQKPMILPMIYS